MDGAAPVSGYQFKHVLNIPKGKAKVCGTEKGAQHGWPWCWSALLKWVSITPIKTAQGLARVLICSSICLLAVPKLPGPWA